MRTALYFTPSADHALTRAAARWLGRDAYGAPVESGPALDGLDPSEWADLTAAPRRYGFHATLKAPFELETDRSVAGLDAALQMWCAETAPFEIPDITLRRIGRFFALVPSAPSGELQSFASEIVRAFEPFRATMPQAEFARRTAGNLTGRQVENVREWGYPYVFDDFRFHMTLTGPVPDEKAEHVEVLLRRQFAAFIGHPLAIDALALFVEPRAGGDFTVFSRHALRQP